MGLGDLFTLAKLTIEGFKDEKRTGKALGKFTAQYNPETLSMHHESVFQGQRGLCSSSGKGKWSHSQPKRLAVNLVLDGTNVGYMGVQLLLGVPTVAEQINDFLAACYQLHSESHEPLYLKLHWGQALRGFAKIDGMAEPRFDCQLESVDVNYKTFARDGSPLHAELAAVFVQQLDPKKSAAQLDLHSADLTHRRVVMDGDTLPLLCREIYGSSSHYLRVAQVNGLDDFRSLTPGQELMFPPFDRARKT